MPDVFVFPKIAAVRVVDVKLGDSVRELTRYAEHGGVWVLVTKGVLNFLKAWQSAASAEENQQQQ
jgi:hypothetical protein